MATLKIVAERTHWITDVAQLVVYGYFKRDPGEDIYAAVRREDKLVGLCHSCVDFGDEENGVSIGVLTKNQSEMSNWVVPVRSCFLMADNGRTIDRI